MCACVCAHARARVYARVRVFVRECVCVSLLHRALEKLLGLDAGGCVSDIGGPQREQQREIVADDCSLLHPLPRDYNPESRKQEPKISVIIIRLERSTRTPINNIHTIRRIITRSLSGSYRALSWLK